MKRERRTRGWVRILVSGLAVGLMMLVIGDRGAQMAVSGGIDPLDVLDLQIKPNVLIMFDNTGSMAFGVGLMPGFRRYPVGGDDPMSRVYQSKQAVLQVVRENQNRMNFGLVAFNPTNASRNIDLGHQEDGDGIPNPTPANWESGGKIDGPLMFVSTDANAQRWSWDNNNDGTADLVTCLPNDANTQGGNQISASGSPSGRAQKPEDLLTNQTLGWFCDIRNATTDWDNSVATATFPVSATQSQETFRSFGNRGVHAFPYPAAPTGTTYSPATLRVPNLPLSVPAGTAPFSRASGLSVETCPEGTPNVGAAPGAPSTPVNNDATCRFHTPVCTPGTDCRYYMQSRYMRHNVRYVWRPAETNPGLKLARVEAFACPNPPGGTVGYEPDPDADGDYAEHYVPPITGRITEARPCFAFVEADAAGAAIVSTQAVYYYSSMFYGGGAACGLNSQVAQVVDPVAPCDSTTNGVGTKAGMRPAAPIQLNGAGVPTVPLQAGGFMSVNVAAALTGRPLDSASGLRNGGGTPMGKLLAEIGGVTPGVAAVFPPQASPGQKNYLLIVTDGNDRCMSGGADRYAGFVNEDISSRYVAQEAARLWNNQFDADGPTGPGTPPNMQRGAELLVVAFTNDVNVTFANRVAKGGSGGDTTNTPATGTVPCTPGPGRACRNAFVARTPAELLDQIRAALKQVGNEGEFTAQAVGTVNENVFEFVGLAGFDSNNPDTRYRSSFPVVFQSTFLMPNFEGRLKAFRSGQVTPVWEAGAKLNLRVSGALTAGPYTFAQLRGSATLVDLSTALIKRRIFTNPLNGASVFSGSAPVSTLPNVPLWPPTTNTGEVAPTDLSAGQLDGQDLNPANLDPAQRTGLAIGNLTFAQVQAAFPEACRGAAVPAECTNPATQDARARKEAREIILAFTAGARVDLDTAGLPSRNVAGDLLYEARPWVLAESTLSTPAVIGPPPAITPALHPDEWKLYLDGPRDVNNRLITTSGNPVKLGFGLRNPDLLDPGPVAASSRPLMTVIYAGSNHLLHAFRAGPQACSSTAACPGPGTLDSGGEELWAFVPHDLLPMLKNKMKTQTREDHTFMIASSMRFGDVFLPGAFTDPGGVVRTGRWRTLMVFGRGIGGKYYTAMDVTGTGPFNQSSVDTPLPQVLWNRGNPDTDTGMASGNPIGTSPQDAIAYAKMGETWSVPSILPLQTQLGGNEYVVAMGSGFSDVGIEGQTFYVVAPTTGTVLFSHDIPPAGGAPLRRNALVAGPTGFVPVKVEPRQVNPADGPTAGVVIGDMHGRIWKFGVPFGGAPTDLLGPRASTDQPFGVPVSALNLDGGSGTKILHVYAVSGHDNRIFFSKEVPIPTPPFKIFGLRGDNGNFLTGFPINFPERFRGSTQPLVSTSDAPPREEAFFIGTQFNPPNSGQANPCVSSFDSFLAAVQARNGGNAIFDLASGAGDDRFAVWRDQKVVGITARGGNVVLDTGLGSDAPPPPPPPPAAQNPNSRPSVFTRAMRVGTTVCN